MILFKILHIHKMKLLITLNLVLHLNLMYLFFLAYSYNIQLMQSWLHYLCIVLNLAYIFPSLLVLNP